VEEIEVSLCLITEGIDAGLLSMVLEGLHRTLMAARGEVILVGDLNGIDVPDGVKTLDVGSEARSRRRGWLRNVALSQARGKLLLSGDSTPILGPQDWPDRLLEWSCPIEGRVPYLFGFRVTSHEGRRLWDWVQVDSKGRFTLVDYGEQAGNLAVAAGYIGMSRAAWELSGGFRELGGGPGEEVEFSLRVSREGKIPLVFSDALHAVRVTVPLILSAQGADS
jgi:hypothetical protein